MCEIPSLADALGLMPRRDPAGEGEPGAVLPGVPQENLVVSAAGAGGKTTTLHRLADEFAQQGQKVLVTTTTHIMEEDEPYFLKAEAEEGFLADSLQMEAEARAFSDRVRERLNRYGQAWTGMPASRGKLCGLPESFMELVWGMKIPVLIEADGARKMPLKVPAGHEPVIHPRTTHVLSVYGLDAVGERLKDTCFREELAETILKKSGTDRVTAEDIAYLAASPEAGRKGCPAHAAYTVILNKADNAGRREDALAICGELKSRGIRRIIITSYAGVTENTE